jgi:ribonuclease HI
VFAKIYARANRREKKPTAVKPETPKPEANRATVHFDGSCRPNPGPMGVGYTLRLSDAPDEGRVLAYGGGQIGQGTNNEAEYQAALVAIRHALRLGFWHIDLVSDSQLLVNQISGVWAVRKAKLRRLCEEAQALLALPRSGTIRHVRREENEEADLLSRDMVFHEPSLPECEKKLYPWQAAAIRLWWLQGERNSARLARIFDIAPTEAERVGDGTYYRESDFSELPDWGDFWLRNAEARRSVEEDLLFSGKD